MHDLPKPDIDVPIYRQNLRRNLMRAVPVAQVERPSWFALGAVSFCAGLFGVLSVLFVARPEVPSRLNQIVAGAPVETPAPSGNPVVIPNLPEDTAARYRVAADGLLADQRLTSDADRAFIEYHMRRENPDGRKPRIMSIKEEGVLSIRRYITDDGREMVVYTRLVDGESEKEQIY